MTAAMPFPHIGSPQCEWVPLYSPDGVTPCGELATWHVTTHDFESTDPNATRLWLMCADCALGLLVWAQKEHEMGSGTNCRGCSALIFPMLGAVIISAGQLDNPETDVNYAKP